MTAKDRYQLIRGWVRLWIWSVCPSCNHNAPKLYDCNICEYYKQLPRYKSDQTYTQKAMVWENFKKKSNNQQ